MAFKKPPLISTQSVWRRLGVCRATFYARVINDSDFPAPIRIGRRTFWEAADIESYIEKKRSESARPQVRATP